MAKKTDNHNPKVKLDLRRYFLRKYHSDGSASVMDCCQGGGVMWHTLRDEFAIRSYWGVDVKPKKGRLKIDSVRILTQPGWNQNVIDIDTYGSPWKHWMAMLPNVTQPTTVFLTIGNQGQTAMQPGAHGGKEFFNFPPSTPQSLSGAICREFDVAFALSQATKYTTITEAIEAVSDGNARYIGVRLEPIKNDLPAASTASKPKQSKAVRSNANV